LAVEGVRILAGDRGPDRGQLRRLGERDVLRRRLHVEQRRKQFRIVAIGAGQRLPHCLGMSERRKRADEKSKYARTRTTRKRHKRPPAQPPYAREVGGTI